MRGVQRSFTHSFALVAILAIAVAISAGYFAFYIDAKKSGKLSIEVNSFEDCAKFYPVMESYPEQCNTPDGKHFTRELTKESKVNLNEIAETEDWQTYANELGVSFKYPADWEVLPSRNRSDIVIRPLVNEGPLHISGHSFAEDTQAHLKEYYHADSQDVEYFRQKPLNNPLYKVTEYEIKWKNNIPAYGAGTTSLLTVIESNDLKFVFEDYTASKNPLPGILETFRFLQ